MNNIAQDNLGIDNLVIGENFYLIFKNQIFCEAQIFNKSENCFHISIFTGQANYEPVAVNKKVQFIITNKNLAFNCSSQVLESMLEDGFQLAVLTLPKIINKIERRIHARVELIMPVYYFNLPAFTQYNYINEVPQVYFNEMKKTFTIDISNNGMKMITYNEKIF